MIQYLRLTASSRAHEQGNQCRHDIKFIYNKRSEIIYTKSSQLRIAAVPKRDIKDEKNSMRARTPRREFAELIRTSSSSSLSMPLTHVTDAYSFRDIVKNQTLRPSNCSIFEANLVYLFYGRPAYRAAAENESNGSDAYWPFCFIMKSDDVKIKRVYPFDSGAFHFKRFDEFMYHKMIKEDFELDPDPETPSRLISLYWRDSKSYFNADGLKDFRPNAFDFEAKAYLELIKHRGKSPFDERNSAVEIQVEEQIPLRGRTIAVILPNEFATEEMLSKIDGLGALALPFDVVRRHGPTEMVGQIYTIVRDLLGGGYGGAIRCW